MVNTTPSVEDAVKGMRVNDDTRSDIATTAPEVDHATGPRDDLPAEEIVFDVSELSVYYGDFRAVRDVEMKIHRNEITAMIGPSGCGKSTVLRSFNRMNDLIPSARVVGNLLYRGVDLYDERVDPVEVRRRIGMVFQKPNPFPKSIYDNVAYGPRVAGRKKGLDEVVESSLRKAALWDAFTQNYDRFSEQAHENFRMLVGRELDSLYHRHRHSPGPGLGPRDHD